jgi:hypothetical protein
VGLHNGRHRILWQAVARLPDAEEIARQGRRCGVKDGTREAKQQGANMPGAPSDQIWPIREHVWNFAGPAWSVQVKPGKSRCLLCKMESSPYHELAGILPNFTKK